MSHPIVPILWIATSVVIISALVAWYLGLRYGRGDHRARSAYWIQVAAALAMVAVFTVDIRGYAAGLWSSHVVNSAAWASALLAGGFMLLPLTVGAWGAYDRRLVRRQKSTQSPA